MVFGTKEEEAGVDLIHCGAGDLPKVGKCGVLEKAFIRNRWRSELEFACSADRKG